MLPSKSDAKQEARFATRLDVLMERVDTLASTVAHTASATAKKDGELAALQRAIEARDETLRALVEHVNRAAAAPAADVPVDATELRSLRNAVAALTKERAGGVNAAQIENLVGTARALDARVQELAAAVAAPPVPTPHPATTARLEALAAEVEAMRTELSRPPAELMATLATLAQRVDGLAAREAGVTIAQLEERVGVTHDALSRHSERLDEVVQALENLDRTRADDGKRLEQRLERTEAAVRNGAHRLDALLAQSPRLDALDETVEELERMRDADGERLSRHLEATDAALARQSSVLDSMDERLGLVENARAADEERLGHGLGEAGDALATLSQRMDALPTFDEAGVDRRLAATEDALATLSQRLDATGELLEALRPTRALEDERLDRRFEETSETLARLSQRVDAVQTVDEAQLERRLEGTDGVLATLTQRLDALADSVDSAAANLGEKEHEMAALHRNVTESSTRIESIVADIREALRAFPEQSATTVDEVAARLERLESTTRKANETTVRAAGELTARIEAIDHRVATVAEEVSRAKTLWPVALRSLEARLDDAVQAPRAEPVEDDFQHVDPSDDLIVGLRDSLEAMESVAAEIARASETLGEQFDGFATEHQAGQAPTELAHPPDHDAVESPAATAGGATIVPLRAGDP